MLTGLSIRDFVLIAQLELAPQGGLTVLTGETGAGKSILLDALGAACGARSEAGLVSAGAEKASVSASFALKKTHPALRLLKENELESEGGEVILRRVIQADGRSKAFVNDQPVSVNLLREIGSLLVEVHGQFDTHGLLDPKTHREALDRFAGIDPAPLEAAWAAWQAAAAAEAQARAELAAAQAQEALLQDAVDELNKLAPQAGEEEALTTKRQLLQSREKIASALGTADNAISGEDGAEGALATASRALGKILAQAGPQATEALAHIDRARDAVAEAQNCLERVQDELGAGGASLEQVEDRLYSLRAAARRHQVSLAELPELAEKLNAQLALLGRGEAQLHDLAAACHAAEATYMRLAKAQSEQRSKAALKLDRALRAELAPLKLERATFTTVLSPKAPGPDGVDDVSFTVSTNPGSPAGPLNKIASGGELARFMLALKVVLAGSSDAVTLIFDEIDQGVGGAVAAAVGERLSRLATSTPILVVTHSPQVAAKAQQHWRVEKALNGKTTRTSVRVLDAASRQEELARMLAGETITEASRHAAAALLTREG